MQVFDSIQPYKRAIMIRAWQIRRESKALCPFGMGDSMSEALKASWAEYKSWQAMQADKAAFDKSREKWLEANEIEAALRQSSTLGRLRHLGMIRSRSNAKPCELAFYPEDLTGLGHVFTRNGGLSPDQAATFLGFESTCEMWEALRAETGKTTAIIKTLKAA